MHPTLLSYALLAAAQDFDGDGFADLAVSAPGEDTAAGFDSGVLHLIRGSPRGLASSGSQLFDLDAAVLLGSAEAYAYFGQALAFGDFNGDGYDDLAVSSPYDDLGTRVDAGQVNVLYGGPAGLMSGPPDQLWTQESAGVPGDAAAYDYFGAALAAADFNGDGRDDLAVGVSFDDLGAALNAGTVLVLYGTGTGLDGGGAQSWHQDAGAMADAAEANDFFGAVLEAGDFNADGFADLAVAVTGEDLAAAADAGAVQVLYGAAGGLGDAGNALFHQGGGLLAGSADGNDRFGRALAAGDFDADGADELAIGVPHESSGGEAGVVHVLRGGAAGLSDAGNQLWQQGADGLSDQAEARDQFGFSLAAGDFNGDGSGDLLIGVPQERFTVFLQTGAAHVLYGAAGTGLSAAGNRFAFGRGNTHETLGSTAATGDFNGDGFADAVLGDTEGRALTVDDAGKVVVAYGGPGGLGRIGIQSWSQEHGGIAEAGEAEDDFGYAVAR